MPDSNNYSWFIWSKWCDLLSLKKTVRDLKIKRFILQWSILQCIFITYMKLFQIHIKFIQKLLFYRNNLKSGNEVVIFTQIYIYLTLFKNIWKKIKNLLMKIVSSCPNEDRNTGWSGKDTELTPENYSYLLIVWSNSWSSCLNIWFVFHEMSYKLQLRANEAVKRVSYFPLQSLISKM